MGKGTITINPYYANRSIMSTSAIVGLLPVLVAYTDAKHSKLSTRVCIVSNRLIAAQCYCIAILSKAHYLLYNLACAMYPRFLITLDENLDALPVTVRVGQASRYC